MLRGPGSFWPSRLIEIGVDSSAPSLRLVLRHEVENSADQSSVKTGYAALSYCWGTAPHAAKQAKTKTNTLEQRRRGIPESDLTPLVLDTVKVCKALGIAYLWVDALCILQDSVKDWEVESMAMAEIYGGAAITICPLEASHCEESFLDRKLDRKIEVSFTSKLRPRIKGSYTLRYAGVEQPNEIESDGSAPADSLERVLRNSPWMKRGWTYQEMQLSRQMLCFGKSRTWLMGTLHAITAKGDFEYPKPTILPTISEEVFTNGLSDRHKATYMWMSLVEGYSSRSLTYRKDVFPALSGLAKIFSESFKDEYLAGLWKKDLLRQLLWTISQEEIFRQPNLPFRSLEGLLGHLSDPNSSFAPSWSWASRNITIEYNTEGDAAWRFRDEVERVDAQTQVEGSNPFGPVSTGTVRLRTKMKSLDFSKARPYSDADMSASSSWVVRTGVKKVYCHFDWITKALPPVLSNEVQILLMLSARWWLNDDTNLDNQVLGLAVLPRDKARNTWVRIGTFLCGGLAGEGDGMDLFEDAVLREIIIV
ncbi:hypothetical protein ACJ41O_012283 [Fusarium nematophilum]